MKGFLRILVLVIVVVVLVAIGMWWWVFSWVDYLWYKDVGAASLLWRKGAWYGLWIFGAFWLPWIIFWLWFGVVRGFWSRFLVGVVIVLGAVSAVVMWWFRELTWAWLVPASGVRELLLKQDVMWYVSWLPWWRFVALFAWVFFGVMYGLDWFLFGKAKQDVFRALLGVFILLLSVLVAMLFSFEILVWQPNKRLGVGFSDFYGTLVAWWVLVGIWFGLVVMWMVQRAMHKLSFSRWFVQFAIASVLAVVFFVGWPWGLVQFYEKPNELRAQKRFIEARRHATREAFGLHYEPFEFSFELESLSSVRLWDPAPYLQYIRQMQTIRNYFDFLDVDVDFYTISNKMEQVLVACRELVLSNLLPESQSWENLHLRYTHGMGMVVSPASLAGEEGQPVFWLKNLSQESIHEEFALAKPQVYFGEAYLPYVFVRTEVPEFEYTDATNRVETFYQATNGVRLSLFRRFAFARVFGEKNIFLTRYFTSQSGVLWKRHIIKRLQDLVPELAYDSDAYPTIVDGEIFWVVDAYTTTDRYPLAERYNSQWGKLNAIRHSVKVVVSAYDGTVHYYVIDKDDPLLAPIRFFAKDLFSEDVPPKFAQHFRYPYQLLAFQAEVFGRYHMDSDESFYNGDDIWTVPVVKQENTNKVYEPIYLLLHSSEGYMPGVFVPFTPLYRQNLSGWLFGVYDKGLHLYQYVTPRTESIPGPSQVEAQIYQNEELAKLFTLWGQRNSSVSLGVTRYLPLGKDVIAVVPLFISSQYNALPQIALVIATYKNKVYYGKTTTELILQIQREESKTEKPAGT